MPYMDEATSCLHNYVSLLFGTCNKWTYLKNENSMKKNCLSNHILIKIMSVFLLKQIDLMKSQKFLQI